MPASTYWLVLNNNNVLGAVNFRHYLNEFLRHYGGHIGQGIRPTERGKGYGAQMLRIAVGIALEMGITAILVTCDKTNIALARTIVKNGGILENEKITPSVKYIVWKRISTYKPEPFFKMSVKGHDVWNLMLLAKNYI